MTAVAEEATLLEAPPVEVVGVEEEASEVPLGEAPALLLPLAGGVEEESAGLLEAVTLEISMGTAKAAETSGLKPPSGVMDFSFMAIAIRVYMVF